MMNGWDGAGSTVDVPSTGDGFTLLSWANASARWQDAVNKPENRPTTNNAVVLVCEDIDFSPATMGF